MESIGYFFRLSSWPARRTAQQVARAPWLAKPESCSHLYLDWLLISIQAIRPERFTTVIPVVLSGLASSLPFHPKGHRDLFTFSSHWTLIPIQAMRPRGLPALDCPRGRAHKLAQRFAKARLTTRWFSINRLNYFQAMRR